MLRVETHASEGDKRARRRQTGATRGGLDVCSGREEFGIVDVEAMRKVGRGFCLAADASRIGYVVCALWGSLVGSGRRTGVNPDGRDLLFA